MPKFAVYYVPEDKFYEAGTSVLGYDIRNGKHFLAGGVLKNCLGSFDEKWVEEAQPFGFHLTVGDAIEFGESIDRIEREIEDILGCFNPQAPFVLTRLKDFVTIWNENIIVLRYEPNDYLKMFHTMIVALVNPLGDGSSYLRSYRKNPKQWGTLEASRIQKFYAPFILDSFLPHFSLLNPYTGADKDNLKDCIAGVFGDQQFESITVNSISLLTLDDGKRDWQIYRTFRK